LQDNQPIPAIKVARDSISFGLSCHRKIPRLTWQHRRSLATCAGPDHARCAAHVQRQVSAQDGVENLGRNETQWDAVLCPRMSSLGPDLIRPTTFSAHENPQSRNSMPEQVFFCTQDKLVMGAWRGGVFLCFETTCKCKLAESNLCGIEIKILQALHRIAQIFNFLPFFYFVCELCSARRVPAGADS
jgi:hypothetical protein